MRRLSRVFNKPPPIKKKQGRCKKGPEGKKR